MGRAATALHKVWFGRAYSTGPLWRGLAVARRFSRSQTALYSSCFDRQSRTRRHCATEAFGELRFRYSGRQEIDASEGRSVRKIQDARRGSADRSVVTDRYRQSDGGGRRPHMVPTRLARSEVVSRLRDHDMGCQCVPGASIALAVGAKFNFPGPGRTRLINNVHVGVGDGIGVEVFVGQIAGSFDATLLFISDAAVDHKVSNMDALGCQFTAKRT